MMIRLLAILSILGCQVARAQFTSLNDGEIAEMQKRVAALEKDSTKLAGSIFFKQLEKARQALSEDPHPIDTIRTEGLLQGHPKKIATAAALADMNKMYALALAWRVYGDKIYLYKATSFLKAWATTNKPNGDPIDDTNLDDAIEAFDLIRNDLANNDREAITGWLQRTAQQEIASPRNAPGRATATNNWNSHRLKIIGEIAFAIGDTSLQSYTLTGLRTQIEKNLKPDGSSIDFDSRDALHYHVYDLEPLLKLSIVLQRARAIDFYNYQSPTGSSIRKSMEWLLPYLDGTKTHAEFVNSTVQFDRDRAKNNEPGYQAGTLFDPKQGAQTLLLATWFDDNLLPKAMKLQASTQKAPPFPILFKLFLLKFQQ
jgi:hypothetical protein